MIGDVTDRAAVSHVPRVRRRVRLVADGAVPYNIGMLAVHEPNRFIHIAVLIDNRIVYDVDIRCILN